MKKTVMIVDDVAFVRKTLSEILGEAGFTIVAEASTGKEAIEFYKNLRPMLVTMDLVMPQMSGIEATKEILKLDKNAAIVMISAMDQVHLVMDAIAAGARDYIQKPFHSQDVKNVLDRTIRGDLPSDAMSTPRVG